MNIYHFSAIVYEQRGGGDLHSVGDTKFSNNKRCGGDWIKPYNGIYQARRKINNKRYLYTPYSAHERRVDGRFMAHGLFHHLNQYGEEVVLHKTHARNRHSWYLMLAFSVYFAVPVFADTGCN